MELFAADGHDAGGCERVTGKSGMRPILVGGAAATVHGSARLTLDVDIVYQRTPENLARLVNALAP